MSKAKTARIRMLGNQWEYEVGKEYDVDLDTANNLTGMGMAVLIGAIGSELDVAALAATGEVKSPAE